ncbi:MAG: DUF1643 domain-containing protein [Flavobacteriaceae bacterium]
MKETHRLKSVEKGAIFSDCKRYRYQLWRIWDQTQPKVLFIMLNPSKANAEIDDPTIRRCMGFAKSWGYGGLYVGNLFAYRSTDPKGLLLAEDIRGTEGLNHWIQMSNLSENVVCAWGNSSLIQKLKPRLELLKTLDKPLFCIQTSKDGTPKHPLYLKMKQKPIPFHF